MILLASVASGFLTSLLRAVFRRRWLNVPILRLGWLVFASLIPHLLAFNLPSTRASISDMAAAMILITTQGMLLVFAWANRRQPGFWMLGLGLVLNLLVIIANGGWMPISPETIQSIAPHAAPGSWQIGQRLGSSKDIVLLASQTRLYWLSDCLLLPAWIPYRAALSIGDVLIAVGAFQALWTAASANHNMNKR